MHRKWKIFGLVGLAAVVVPMTAFAAAPDATTDFVLDLWNSRGNERRIRDYQAESTRMDVVIREAADRMSVKEQLIGELLAGRMTFDEVVTRFEVMNAGRPMSSIWLPPGLTDLSDEEKAARSVLSYVAVRGNPAGAELPRFAGEYEARFGRSYQGKK
jgi:hypothetical protein